MTEPDWQSIAEMKADTCHSATLRGTAVKLAARLSRIGPIRYAPEREFVRIYESLRWNDRGRIWETIDGILQRTKGPPAKVDAWGYLIAAHDEWVLQARIFFLTSTILEGTLRARLDARMSDMFGEYWPEEPEALPSALHELTSRSERDAQLAAVHAIVEALNENGGRDLSVAMERIRAALRPPSRSERMSGKDFVSTLTFGGLRMILERKKTWEGKAGLQALFKSGSGAIPAPNRDEVQSVLKVLNEARNEMSHLRPNRYRTFEEPLINASRLAAWFGYDLQHIYESIDTRTSTEMGEILVAAEATLGRPPFVATQCSELNCNSPTPFVPAFPYAPTTQDEAMTIAASALCLIHRVQNRERKHRGKTT